MREIADQKTYNDSSRRDAKRADHRSGPKTQRHNVASAREQRKNMPLEPISLLVGVKVPASIATETGHSDVEEHRRVHEGEEALAAGALHEFIH
jgi:hypothetical protein